MHIIFPILAIIILGPITLIGIQELSLEVKSQKNEVHYNYVFSNAHKGDIEIVDGKICINENHCVKWGQDFITVLGEFDNFISSYAEKKEKVFKSSNISIETKKDHILINSELSEGAIRAFAAKLGSNIDNSFEGAVGEYRASLPDLTYPNYKGRLELKISNGEIYLGSSDIRDIKELEKYGKVKYNHLSSKQEVRIK